MTTHRSSLDTLRTLPALLARHAQSRPDAVLYRVFDSDSRDWRDVTARETMAEVTRRRRALAAVDGLHRGERIAMLLPNSLESVLFDQAVLSNALIPVPLHAIDTPNSSAFILNDAGARVLVTNKLLKWKQIREAADFPQLKLVVLTDETDADDLTAEIPVMTLATFLKTGEGVALSADAPVSDDLAAIVYTSGTTGNPKGVMLTHANILANVRALAEIIPFEAHETWLSFLPLSHTLERTTSYYLSLALGHTTAFNRSIATLQEDLKTVRPTCLMSVPRVYEMIRQKFCDALAKKGEMAERVFHWAEESGWRRFARQNGLASDDTPLAVADKLVGEFLDDKLAADFRALFGGRVRLLFSGGAPLSTIVSKTYAAFGMPICQGYGLTETSPAITLARVGSNDPATVGPVLPNLEVRLGDNNELEVRGPSVMAGYWHREDATREVLTEDGWFKSGDVAHFDEAGRIRITGRIKEIIVTSTGEKVPPADLEAAIEGDRLFSQALVTGDNRPFIAALAVVNPEEWKGFCEELGVDAADPASLAHPEVLRAALRRVKMATADFPNYGVPRRVALLATPWTVENGMLTPTMKKKRRVISAYAKADIEAMYEALGAQNPGVSSQKRLEKLCERVESAVFPRESAFCKAS